MARANIKLLLVVITCFSSVALVTMWVRCESPSPSKLHVDEPLPLTYKTKGSSPTVETTQDHGKAEAPLQPQVIVEDLLDGNKQQYDAITCSINQEYTVGCRKEGDDIFLPFSFLEKYFEVYGSIETGPDGVPVFEWSHSYSKISPPKQAYNSSGVFLYFDTYSVETRPRVKCVSGVKGVPVSTQWDKRGHFYPTQIAQYGLSHFSKNLTEPPSKITVLNVMQKSRWHCDVTYMYDDKLRASVMEFTGSDDKSCSYSLDSNSGFFISMDILFLDKNGELTISVKDDDKGQLFLLRYTLNDVMISVKDNEVLHGIGDRSQWSRFARDIIVDLKKGYGLMRKKKKISPKKLRLQNVFLRGKGRIGSFNLSSSEHLSQFYAAANWFVDNQESTGGWGTSVRRIMVKDEMELTPGWYNAMAQGQAISLLTRAYSVTKREEYLAAAARALHPFKVRSEDGGVRAEFMGKFAWFEEYPTVPNPLYVLNGFIYSLFGLYDLKVLSPGTEYSREAALLYEEGIQSLKKLLPFFDTGSGSMYDLRHFTLGKVPNLARWDYHSTHVNQLLYLSTIDREPVFKETAERWATYMKGKRAPHN